MIARLASAALGLMTFLILRDEPLRAAAWAVGIAAVTFVTSSWVGREIARRAAQESVPRDIPLAAAVPASAFAKTCGWGGLVGSIVMWTLYAPHPQPWTTANQAIMGGAVGVIGNRFGIWLGRGLERLLRRGVA